MTFREERIGPHRLFLGDCLDVMPTLGKVDAVVTDPPYGIADKWKGGFGVKSGWANQHRMKDARNGWDAAPIGEEEVKALLGAAKNVIVWGGNYFELPPSRCWLVWRKEVNHALTLGDGELAWTNLDKPLRVFDHPRNKATGALANVHPAQKPVALMEWCLGFLPDAKTILDPFAGSGTTGVACQKLGRTFIGIEKDPDYFAIMCKRIDEAMRQPDLFIAPPPPAKQEAMDI